MDDEKEKREGIQHIDVTGKNPKLWASFQLKLVETINTMLDTVVDPRRDTTLRQETKEFTSAGLDYLKARLQKAPLKNDKERAEITEIYQRIEHEQDKANKTRAETRVLNAEATAKERGNAIKNLQLALKLTKVMLVGEPGEEAVLFGKQIDSYLEVLEEFIGI